MACISVCLFVCLCSINDKTAQFFCGNSHCWSKLKICFGNLNEKFAKILERFKMATFTETVRS